MRQLGFVLLVALSLPVMAKSLDRLCEQKAGELALKLHQSRFEQSADTADVWAVDNRGTLGNMSDILGKPITLYTVLISDEVGKSTYAVLRYYNEKECELKPAVPLADEMD